MLVLLRNEEGMIRTSLVESSQKNLSRICELTDKKH